MTVNLDIIGKPSEPIPFTYDEDTVILYALGIGAGIEQLDYIYEKRLKVLPTFAVVPLMPILLSYFIPKANLNLPAVLHAGQEIVLHRQIPPSGTLYSTLVCDSIFDKGDKGAVVYLSMQTVDHQDHLVFQNRAVFIDRSAGNFGGERGPKLKSINYPVESDPSFHVESNIPLDQAALYRLSGDKNPLHIDPDFARSGGLPRPILHGLCSFGYAARAIISNACDNQPERLKSFSTRFMNIVYPGDCLITEGWAIDEKGAYLIRTTNQSEEIVLGHAMAIVDTL